MSKRNRKPKTGESTGPPLPPALQRRLESRRGTGGPATPPTAPTRAPAAGGRHGRLQRHQGR